jgi:8-oxo-dGTP pyrophosphatase MutT (NUDIX family)
MTDRPRRIDYYNDPDAPRATTIVPSVNVVLENTDGHILLIRRSDNGNWALPGGAIDIGESVADAAVREVQEETGITCQITGLIGVYSNPHHVIHYTSNNEVRQEFSVVLSATPTAGEPTRSDESTEVRWLDPSGLADLPIHPSMRQRITDWQSREASPRLR